MKREGNLGNVSLGLSDALFQFLSALEDAGTAGFLLRIENRCARVKSRVKR